MTYPILNKQDRANQIQMSKLAESIKEICIHIYFSVKFKATIAHNNQKNRKKPHVPLET